MLKTGFVAQARGREVRLRTGRHEWLTAAQLIKISDVTDEVNKGVAATDNEIQTKQKRDANNKTILDAAMKADPELVPQIVSLYQGAVVQLYQYKAYDDIRLVILPHVQAAHFGGDPDNFAFPRHSIDFAFLRAYEDGKPADTSKHYFRWKSGGAQEDELVFVSGNPGTTNRLSTKAQLEFERDIKTPMKVEWLTNRLRILQEQHGDPRQEHSSWHRTLTFILESENGLRAARGHLHGLEDAQLMAQKAAAEQAFRDRVMADEELAEKYGDLWDRIARVVEQRRLHEARARFHTTGGMVLIQSAIIMVRACDPTESEAYRRQTLEEIGEWGGGGIPNGDAIAIFDDHVVRARAWLPTDDPYFPKVLGGRSGREFLEVMFGWGGTPPSLVCDPEQRVALVEAGWTAIQDSEDVAIVAARELLPLIRANEKLGAELDAKEEALRAELGRALFECYGTKVSPDGTMTLRFTDGVVRGLPSNGTIAPPHTTFYGLYDRNAEFGNEYPFNLPKTWLDRKDKIDMATSVNFVSTNDITGGRMAFKMSMHGAHILRDSSGSSGSVVVNKDLEAVGVVADGNTESLHNDFVFTDDVPRAVSAHVDGIMEALVKIYGAHHIAEELTGR